MYNIIIILDQIWYSLVSLIDNIANKWKYNFIIIIYNGSKLRIWNGGFNSVHDIVSNFYINFIIIWLWWKLIIKYSGYELRWIRVNYIKYFLPF